MLSSGAAWAFGMAGRAMDSALHSLHRFHKSSMGQPPELSIVIPAYNEEFRIAPTIRDIVGYCRARALHFELLLVDDGSRDGTSAVGRLLAAELPEVRVIRLPTNHGKGYAVRTGV